MSYSGGSVNYFHDISLNVSVTSTAEDVEDLDPEVVIAALESRLAALKRDPKNWRDYVEHYGTSEV